MDLSLADAARILGVPEHALYWRVRRGEIPAHLVGERYRFNKVELLEWAAQHDLATLPPLDPEQPASLGAALRRGGIHRDLQAADRDAALRALAECLPLPGAGDRELLIELLMSRESLGTTAVGGEIALPHPRQPIALGRREPLAALGLLARGVDFGAPDGRPVRALLMLVSPTPRQHLAMLGRAARAFSDPTLRARVLEAAGDGEILARLEALESEWVAAGPAPARGAERG
jgi:PTS system nitrogen regulatory IIA component